MRRVSASVLVTLDGVRERVEDDVDDVVVLERVVRFPADPVDPDEVETAEELQMLGHERLGQPRRIDDVRDRRLAVGEDEEHLQP